MVKTFSKIEINTIKTIAKNVAPYAAKKERVENQIKEVEEKVAEQIRKRVAEKIEKLEAEKKSYQDIIDSMNDTVKKITNGYTTEDLVNRVVEHTGKMDEKTGKEILQTRYVLKYPETVVPPVEGEGQAAQEGEGDSQEAAGDAAPAEEAQPEGAEDTAGQDAGVQAESADPFAQENGWQ